MKDQHGRMIFKLKGAQESAPTLVGFVCGSHRLANPADFDTARSHARRTGAGESVRPQAPCHLVWAMILLP